MDYMMHPDGFSEEDEDPNCDNEDDDYDEDYEDDDYDADDFEENEIE